MKNLAFNFKDYPAPLYYFMKKDTISANQGIIQGSETIATQSWVNSQGFLKSIPYHTHDEYSTNSHWHYDSAGGSTGSAEYSSLRYKTEINSLKLNLDNFKPVQFKYNEILLDHHHDDDRIHYGFIAEELEQVNPDLVIYNEEG